MIKFKYSVFVIFLFNLTSTLRATDLGFVRENYSALNTCLQNMAISDECPTLVQEVNKISEEDFLILRNAHNGNKITDYLCNYFNS